MGIGDASHEGRVGRHLLADMFGVCRLALDDAGLLESCLASSAARSGLTPVSLPILHRFPGGGVTGVILLAESHIAFHSYPERGYLALDLFTCGDSDGAAALRVFEEALAPDRVVLTEVDRGREPGE